VLPSNEAVPRSGRAGVGLLGGESRAVPRLLRNEEDCLDVVDYCAPGGSHPDGLGVTLAALFLPLALLALILGGTQALDEADPQHRTPPRTRYRVYSLPCSDPLQKRLEEPTDQQRDT
jgi:hypothetical protein